MLIAEDYTSSKNLMREEKDVLISFPRCQNPDSLVGANFSEQGRVFVRLKNE